MYLKEVELKGFKSFGEKVKLSFSPVITCIVGPNGAGKSNLVEAIRFATGETAMKSMRSSALQDVIFTGAAEKVPLSFCYVGLTFDNRSKTLPLEASEVKVVRKIYRDGESEFTINGLPVKLRDIHQLLLGTGLGKDTYAFVLQGQIERVLSAKPEERRLVLEEAAGISRLFVKKKVALRNLEKTELQLIRVSDILSTLSAQIPVLERQAKRAEKLQAMREELLSLEKNWFAYTCFKTQKELRRLEQESEDARLLVQHYDQEIERIQEKMKGSRQKRQAYFEALEEQQRERARAQKQMVQASEEIAYLQKWIRTQDAQCEEWANEWAASAVKLLEIEKQEKALQEEQKILHQSCEKQAVRKRRKAKWLNTFKTIYTEAEQMLNQQQALLFEEEKKRLEIKNKEAFEKKMREEWRKQQAHIEAELSDTAHEWRKQRQLLEQALARKENVIQERQQREANLLQLGKAIKAMSEKLNVERSKCDAIQKERIRLEAMRDAKKGGVDIQRAFAHLQQVSLDASVVGTLQELIGTVGHRGIETYLEGKGDALVVEGWQAARDCAQELEKMKIPFALFVLEADRRLPLSARLLARFTSVDHAKKIDQEKHNYVAYSGTVKEGDWVWYIPRKEETASLLRELNETEQKLWEGFIRKQQEQAQLVQEKEREEKKLQEISTEEVLLNNEWKQREKLMDQLFKTEQELKNELADLQAKTEHSIEDAEAKPKDSDRAGQERLEQLHRRWKKAGSLYEKALLLKEREEREHEARERTFSENIKQAETIGREKANEKGRRDAIYKKIEAWRRERQEAFLKIESNNEIAQREQKKWQEQEADLEQKRAELTNIEQENEGLQLEEAEIQKKLTELRETLWMKEKGKEEVVKTKEELTRMLQEESHLDPATIPPSPFLPQPEEEFEARLKKMRNRVRWLGGADEESITLYRQQKEEEERLSKQKDDLEQSIEEIRKGIHHIDIAATRDFSKVFQEVKLSFADTFRDLFGGGEAELQLAGEGPLLKRGIEILVTLPGKKRQKLQLLSGGEKSLIALAFILAILKVKPSPFIVLDEVDAALDESSIQRFRKLIYSFEQTQFIMITHNRRTMEMAEHIYGVTQETPGVSKVVSLPLSQIPINA